MEKKKENVAFSFLVSDNGNQLGHPVERAETAVHLD